MQTLHLRLLKLPCLPLLALLITVLSATSTSAQTITSREVVQGTNSLDIYTYYAEGIFSQSHVDSDGTAFGYTFDFNTGHSARVFISTTSTGYTSYIVSDSELGLINLNNGWFGSPFYTSGNPFDASVQNSMALLFQQMPNLDPWGEEPWDGGGMEPPSPIRP